MIANHSSKLPPARFDLLSQTGLGEPEAGVVRATASDPLAAFMATMTSGVASRGMAVDMPGNWEAQNLVLG